MRAWWRFAWCSLALLCLAMPGCTISSTPGTQTPVSLSILPANPTLPLGLSQSFFAVAQLHDGTSQDVTSQTQWTSSNPAVASIDSKGTLKTVSQGTTTLNAAYGSLRSSTGVTVTPPGVIAVNISPANPNPIQVGDTLAFTATGTMSNGSTPPDITNKVTWASSNTSVASITSAGTATADAVGITVISATYGSGQTAPAGFVTLIVNPLLQSVSVLPAAATIAQSTTQQFTAMGIYSDGSTQDITSQSSTQWTCSPSGIASSVTKGLARVGTALGTCNVTATATLSNGTTVLNNPPSTLTVGNQALTALSVTPAIPTRPIGVPVQFTATGQFSGVQDVTSAPGITWSSSNSAVAAKPLAGKTNTLAAGTTTITAKFGSTTATTTLAVTSATLSAITITTPLTKLGEGTTVQLKATGKFTDNSTQDLTNAVSWKSSASAIGVSASGLVTANLPGSASVTASLDGVSASTPALQVNPETIKSIAITPQSASIAPGTTQPFKATVTFSDTTQQDITSLLQWNSSVPATATIADFGVGAGVATGLSSGTSNISAVFGSVDAASPAALTVTSASPLSVTVTPATPNLALGTSQQLTATANFSVGPPQDVTSLVTWSSSDITVVVVNGAGLAVTAGNHGSSATANVTALFTSPLGTQSGLTTITVH